VAKDRQQTECLAILATLAIRLRGRPLLASHTMKRSLCVNLFRFTARPNGHYCPTPIHSRLDSGDPGRVQVRTFFFGSPHSLVLNPHSAPLSQTLRILEDFRQYQQSRTLESVLEKESASSASFAVARNVVPCNSLAYI
jgi:hypothetical protein